MRAALLVIFAGISATTLVADAPPAARQGSVRLLCTGFWIDPDRLTELPRCSHDVSVQLAEIGDDATAREVLDRAIHRRHDDNCVSSAVALYRWNDAEQAYIRLDRSASDRSVALMRDLRDGDVLIFHGWADSFGASSRTPNQAMQLTAPRLASALRVATSFNLQRRALLGSRSKLPAALGALALLGTSRRIVFRRWTR
jgi:hypothetical protein